MLKQTRRNRDGWLFLFGVVSVSSVLLYGLYYFLGISKGLDERPVASCQFPDLEPVLSLVQTKYVRPDVPNTQTMFRHAMQKMALSIPEMSIATIKGKGKEAFFEIQLPNKKREIVFSKKNNFKELGDKTQEVYQFVCSEIKKSSSGFTLLEEKKLQFVVINAMLQTLDPHSRFVDEKQTQQENQQHNGKYVGIGVVLSRVETYLEIVSMIDQGPAEQAGLEVGDKIITVDGMDVSQLLIDNIIEKIQGPESTLVRLEIYKKNGTKKSVSIERKPLMMRPYTFKLTQLNGKKIAVMRLNTFDDASVEGLIQKLTVHSQEPDGYLLDLRGNPGGLLTSAVDLVDQFLSAGTITSLVHLSLQKDYFAKEPSLKAPLVVLINESSASASEVVAGALKDHQRALVMGRPSFGKSTAQHSHDLASGARLVLTENEFLIAGHHSIQGVGVIPHIELRPVVLSNQDNGLDMLGREKVQEKELPYMLASSNTKSEPPLFRLPYLLEYKNPAVGSKLNDIDPEVAIGLSFLSRLSNRNDSIYSVDESMRNWVDKERDAQNLKIKTKLEDSKHIDWSCSNTQQHGAYKPLLVTFKPEHDELKKSIRGILAVSNPNSVESCQVSVRIEFKDWGSKEIFIGKVPAGKEIQQHLDFHIEQDFVKTIVGFNIQALNAQREVLAQNQGSFKLSPLESVDFSYRYYWKKQNAKDPQELIVAGDTVELKLELKDIFWPNQGNLQVSIDSTDSVTFLKNLFTFDLKQKNIQTVSANFVFKIPQDFSQKDILIQMVAFGSKGGVYLNFPIKIPIFGSIHPSMFLRKTFVRLPVGAQIYDSWGGLSSLLGVIEKETCFPIGMLSDDLVGVFLPNGVLGFVKTKKQHESGECRPDSNSMKEYYYTTKNNIHVVLDDTQKASLKEATIHAEIDEAHADGQVVGAYVEVLTNSDYNEKLPYQKNTKPSSLMKFSQKVPLSKGKNLVQVSFVIENSMGGRREKSEIQPILFDNR